MTDQPEGVRYEVVELCEHGWGYLQPASFGALVHMDEDNCDGGSRRVLEPAKPDYHGATTRFGEVRNDPDGTAATEAIVDQALAGLVVLSEKEVQK